MTMRKSISRRRFLCRAGLGLAAPYALTSQALGGPGALPASDRVATGHIGVGGRGTWLLRTAVGRPNVTVAAVCEIDRRRREVARQRAGGKAAMCHDFRRLLDRQDIDAVVVASPDHWHALHTLHACQAAKDVYVEKPLSVTVRAGRVVADAARRYARVVQMGTQWRSYRTGRLWAQYVRNGGCGRVREVRCWHPRNPTCGPGGFREPPAGLDWDLWLGPLPRRPYHPRMCHGNFRWLMNSGGGNIRDRGTHIIGMVAWAMGIDHTGPVSVEATGTRHPGLYDVPTTMSATWQFKSPDWVLRWDQPGKAHGAQFGAVVYGDKDTLVFRRCDRIPQPAKVLHEARPGETTLYRSQDHFGNFVDCVMSRRAAIMDAETSHRVTTICNLGNVAFRLGRKLLWDPVGERFRGDDEANRLLSLPYRPPWQL